MKKRRMSFEPVVLDKGKRAREMQELVFPGKDGTFFKGYTPEGTQVIVPERDLQEMKSLINLKMRRRGESMYTKTPDEETKKEEFKWYLQKLETLSDKLSLIDYDTEEYETPDKKYRSMKDSELIVIPDSKRSKKSSLKRQLSDEDTEKRTKHSEEVHYRMPPQEEIKTESKTSETESKTSETESKTSETESIKETTGNKHIHSISEVGLTPKQITFTQAIKDLLKRKLFKFKTEKQTTGDMHGLQYGEEPDLLRTKQFTGVGLQTDTMTPKVSTLRFCICGHFTKNKRPVFIIQPYEGDALLRNKKSHLDSKQSVDDGFDVLIAGKFYKKSIIKEVKSIPKYLTIENRKIVINNKSIIFEEGTTHALSTKELQVVVRGRFKKNKITSTYTPSLFIGVEKHSTCEYKPRNKLSRNTRVSRREAFIGFPNTSMYTIQTRGFKLVPTRTEGGETIYESSPPCKAGTDYSSDESTLEEVYESHPRVRHESGSFAKDPYIIQSKTLYGDEVEDDNNAGKDSIHMAAFNKKETIIYECGICSKSKSESSMVTDRLHIRDSQSKTDYGDADLIRARSSQALTENKNVDDKPKQRKPDFLRRINKLIFFK